MTDPIADMLTRIRNATQAKHSRVDIPASTLSFHLKELTQAGLLTQERASRRLIYRAAYAHMADLVTYLTQNCCEGAACAVEASITRSPCTPRTRSSGSTTAIPRSRSSRPL